MRLTVAFRNARRGQFIRFPVRGRTGNRDPGLGHGRKFYCRDSVKEYVGMSEAADSAGRLAPIYQTLRRHIPEHGCLHRID